MPSLDEHRTVIRGHLRAHELAAAEVRRERAALKAAGAALAALEGARKLLQETAAAVQHAAHEQITRVVTTCLRTVFPQDPYEFRVAFEQKRGKTEARLMFVRGGEEYDPTTACGGGVLDVAAFALRVSALLLHQPQPRRCLLLDESFRFVSDRAGHRDRVRGLLEALAGDVGIQLVLVTHDPKLVAGAVVEL